MRWATVTDTQSEDEWFEEYVRVATAQDDRPTLPPERQIIGSALAAWFETEPGIAFIQTKGGSVTDRALAESVVRAQLYGHGIRQASFTIDGSEELRKTGSWDDVMAKAKRLTQAGNVQLLRNSFDTVIGQVKGDHGDYQTEISREDPDSRTITQWQCDCPWDQYAFQRTRQWKKYEARPCSHVLATYWKSLATPLDEDIHPSQGEQQSLFSMPPSAPGGGAGGAPGGPPAPPQGVQMQMPMGMPGQDPNAAQMGAMPQGPEILPPYPYEPQAEPMPTPVSVPGLKPPSPYNPLQYPGGTFSSVGDRWEFVAADYPEQPQGFQNGNMVMTKDSDWGTLIGRSDEHGSGQQVMIPRGSVGEILGQDASGLVNVLFENKMTETMGELEPNGVVAWFWPSQLQERSDIRRPGPAVKRK